MSKKHPKVEIHFAGLLKKINEPSERKRLAILSLIAEELSRELSPSMKGMLIAIEDYKQFGIREIRRKKLLNILPYYESRCFFWLSFPEIATQVLHCTLDVEYEILFYLS